MPPSIVSRVNDGHSHTDALLLPPQESEYFMNDSMSVSVTILSAKNIIYQAKAYPGGMYANAKFGSWDGSNLSGKLTPHFKYSETAPKSHSPNWGTGSAMTLQAEDGLHWAEYVKLSLYDGNKVGFVPAGVVFVPMWPSSTQRWSIQW